MKVLIQNSVFYPSVIGGAEVSSHLLGEELRRRGVATDAVAGTGQVGRGDQLAERPTADGRGVVYEAPSHGLCDLMPAPGAPRPGFVRRSLNHLTSVHSPRWRRLFAEVLDRSHPDVVHTNTIVGLTPAIWAAARDRGVPVVHTLRDYHLLCARTTLLRSDRTDCTRPPLPCRILADLKRRQTGGLTAVTAPSRFVLTRHQQAGFFAHARAEVVPNALEEWPADVPERAADGPVRALFMGQLNHHKGLDLLLDAAAAVAMDGNLPALSLDIAGDGPLAGDVKARAAAAPGHVRYHGHVRGEARRALLRAADLLVVPSIWAEPFGRSIIDGFSWGLPVIAGRVGGIPEVVDHGRDGLLVDPEAGALRDALAVLVADGERRLALGAAARRRAEDFTLARQVDRFQAIYEALVADRRLTDDPRS